MSNAIPSETSGDSNTLTTSLSQSRSPFSGFAAGADGGRDLGFLVAGHLAQGSQAGRARPQSVG